MKKKCVVIHSGGLDSSLCLALAMREFSSENVLSLSFSYNQRHSSELKQAEKICREWKVDHTVVNIDCLKEITRSALIGNTIPIQHEEKEANTLVVGRNGLMAQIGSIHAQHIGAACIYMGIIEQDAKQTGYRDCNREYMDLVQQVMRLDLNDPSFEIRTPLVHMKKLQTLELSYQMGILPYLLKETISCYEGIIGSGCKKCPSCKIRSNAIEQFLIQHPDFHKI